MSKILLEKLDDHFFCDDFGEDIYFQKEYAKFYGKVFEFVYKENGNFLKIVANKKSIKNTSFFDLQSPYGYGGIYSNSMDKAFLTRALENLRQRALKENIVAFFIRFHPFDKNLSFYEKKLDFFLKERKIVIVPIYKNLEQIRANYSPRIKTYVKKARKELEISKAKASDAKDFKRLYDETMRRNQAGEFYFFDDDYFKELFNFKQSLILKASYRGEILAYASFFLGKKFAYYHLSANKNEKNANAALLDFSFELCLNKNIDFILLGGGVKDDDNLFYFKQKFSTLESFFYIGGIVFDALNYKKFCKDYKNNFFLKYRNGGGVVIFTIFIGVKMKYCDYCVMPDTRPGLKFFKDENGKNICSACINHKNKENIDYKARFKELEVLCDKYRRMNGKFEYDCAIAVSGGKDSHFQVHIMKEKLGMNPILFSVEDNFTMTEAGKKNLKNLSETFGCHIISLKPDIKTQKKVMLKTFEKYGKPTWFIDRLIYSYPFAMALKFNTPLLVYGENVSYEYGGSDAEETPSAKEIFLNGVASDLDINEFIDDEIKEENLQLFFNPSKDKLDKLDPIYLSYFIKWNSYSNYIFAKIRGFTDLEGEWDRTMCAENFDQVDSIGYILHAWMKYPKFGHAMASDYAARFVRYGLLSRKEAIELVQKRDHKLDNRCVEDFCNFIGISKTTFWKIVEKRYNMDLFYKNDFGEFKLKNKLQ